MNVIVVISKWKMGTVKVHHAHCCYNGLLLCFPADINECNVNKSLCADFGKKCVNLPGTFNCTCKEGYQILQNGTCIGRYVHVCSL